MNQRLGYHQDIPCFRAEIHHPRWQDGEAARVLRQVQGVGVVAPVRRACQPERGVLAVGAHVVLLSELPKHIGRALVPRFVAACRQ